MSPGASRRPSFMGHLEDQACRIIDSNQFMTLATADADGTPWASPVWFAHVGHRDFVWVSKLRRRHTQHVIDRPEVSLVIFDSNQTPGDVEAVYATGHAQQTDDSVHLEAFSARSTSQGLPRWTGDRVTGASELRIFHVTADRLWVLDDRDNRLPVELSLIE